MNDCFKPGDLITNHKEFYTVIGVAHDAKIDNISPMIVYGEHGFTLYSDMKVDSFDNLKKRGFFTYKICPS